MAGIRHGGRAKGTPNKATLIFREALDKANFSVPAEAVRMFLEDDLKPEHRIRLLELMAAYIYPKPKPAERDEGDEEGMDTTKKALEAIGSGALIAALRAHNEGKA